MKIIYSIILSLLLAASAWADGMIIGAAGGGGGGGDFACVDSDFCDSFGGSGACGDVAQNRCYETWTASGTGAITNEATGLEGTYAKSLDATAGNSVYSTGIIPSSVTQYAYAQINIGELSITSGTAAIFNIRNSTTGGACYLSVVYSAGNILWRVSNDVPANIEAGTPTQAQTYHVWLENVAGVSCRAYIATTGTKPGTPTHDVGSASATATDQLRISASEGGVISGKVDSVKYDKIRVRQSSAYGNNGE